MSRHSASRCSAAVCGSGLTTAGCAAFRFPRMQTPTQMTARRSTPTGARRRSRSPTGRGTRQSATSSRHSCRTRARAQRSALRMRAAKPSAFREISTFSPFAAGISRGCPSAACRARSAGAADDAVITGRCSPCASATTARASRSDCSRSRCDGRKTGASEAAPHNKKAAALCVLPQGKE